MSTILPSHPAAELGFERLCGVIESAVKAVLETDAQVVGVVGGGARSGRAPTAGRCAPPPGRAAASGTTLYRR